MKIKLIKAKFNGTFSYKYLPFEYCCNEICGNETIEFTDRDFAHDTENDELYPIPQFCTSYNCIAGSYEESWEETTNYPIKYCPHCGEKIEVEVVDEIDLSFQLSVLEKKRSSLFKASNKTDSKKREEELREQVRVLDNEINWFYNLAPWNGKYTDEEKI